MSRKRSERLSVQYAKRVVGKKIYGGQTQYMPLKVNYAGVMPIIFAQSLLILPSAVVQMAFKTSKVAQMIAAALTDGGWHYLLYGGMIFFFQLFLGRDSNSSRSKSPTI